MDHSSKRLKVSPPESRSPHDGGSRMKEGLFTSELSMRSNEADGMVLRVPTPTIALSDVRHGTYLSTPKHRPQLVRRNAEMHIKPRQSAATVTASVVDVDVDVGTATLDATVVAAPTADVLVSVSSLGTLTVSAVNNSTATGTSAITTDTLDSSQSVISSTPPPTPLPQDDAFTSTSTDTLTSASTALSFSASTNSTITSSESIVTVTATSTLEFTYANGTFVQVPSTSVVHSTSTVHSSASHSITATGHKSTLTTSNLSSGKSTTSAVFGSTSTAESSLSSGGPPTSTGTGQEGGSATAASSTGSAASASSSSSPNGGSSGPGLTPTQQQVVGGVIGGVAGIAVVLLVALVFLRWYRRRLKSQGRLPEQQPGGAARGYTMDGRESFPSMSERSSLAPFASAMATIGRRLRAQSTNTYATTGTGTTSTTVLGSERGFQRIAGRKIAPVITAGGDQYGGSYGAFEKDVGTSAPPDSCQAAERELTETSFYRDSGGFYGGRGLSSSSPLLSPSASSAPTHSRNVSTTRDFAADSPTITASKPEGFAVLRPSPVRTPTITSPSSSSIKLPIQQAPTLEAEAPPTPALPPHMLAKRDAVGRSLASQDGSRVSKASKGSASRFSERV